MAKNSLAPKQERSRQTLECLLRATVGVLDKYGLEGATIPLIAEEAGVSPASVYRRFEDKDALIRQALLETLHTSEKAVAKAMDQNVFAEKNVADAAKSLVRQIMQQYRGHPKLLTAVRRFCELPTEKAFEKEALRVFSQNFRVMSSGLSACKDLAGVRDRKKRVEFGLLTIVSAIEIMILEEPSLFNVFCKESDEEIQKRLVKMLLAYIHA